MELIWHQYNYLILNAYFGYWSGFLFVFLILKLIFVSPKNVEPKDSSETKEEAQRIRLLIMFIFSVFSWCMLIVFIAIVLSFIIERGASWLYNRIENLINNFTPPKWL